MYLEIGLSNRELVVPVQQNRTGQFLTIRNIEFLQLNKAADWLESSYSETESESEAALVVPAQNQKLTFEFHWTIPTSTEMKHL